LSFTKVPFGIYIRDINDLCGNGECSPKKGVHINHTSVYWKPTSNHNGMPYVLDKRLTCSGNHVL